MTVALAVSRITATQATGTVPGPCKSWCSGVIGTGVTEKQVRDLKARCDEGMGCANHDGNKDTTEDGDGASEMHKCNWKEGSAPGQVLPDYTTPDDFCSYLPGTYCEMFEGNCVDKTCWMRFKEACRFFYYY